ncbi:PspC domain-containing protein [Nocardioides lacusdianchii]|uniref:PspC domain-containing protein n=1 Tax=Nocardioides lacusdianchii TaxID=2783664 RepID=UPI001CC9B93E|nr:PspC domain-containing protein [Nocardioides lacusdianchii]
MDTPSTTPTGTDEQPPPPSSAPAGPRVSREEMKDLGRLRRSITDRHVAGVAGGLARHLDVDVIIIRVALVVGVFFGGAGLIAYVGAWLLVPEEGTDDQPLGLDVRSRSLALAGVGILALLSAVGDWAGAFWFPWPLAIVAAIAIWFLNRKDRAPSGYGYAGPAAPGTAQQPDHTTGLDPTGWDQTGWDQTGWQQTAWQPPEAYARAPRQYRNPRRRGPILFFFTVALIALAEGVLGVVDLVGVAVAESAYPALALGITAAMLVVGAFWGRAGGLIALGLVAALATAATTATSSFPDDRLTYAPTSAAEVRDSYDLGGGELTLDLSDVSDVDALDGRAVTVDGVGGRVEVVVPDGMDVTVRTDLFAGDSRVFDERRDGLDVNLDGFRDGGDEVPDMSITIDLFAGEVIVREAA